MKSKFTWGHGMVLALAGFIVFILGMIFFYTRGYQTSEMVSENYYEDELNYQNVINAKKAAENLEQKPSYSQSAEGIKIAFPKQFDNSNSKFKFYLFRTDDSNLDIQKEVVLDQDNAFFIPARAGILKEGSYTLKVSWKENKGTEYQIDYNLIWTPH
ncbi:nitrogen fixation protein FixH [Elizabethkingia argentiflava]|uniref:Nitrogen fixation protein FixH n=1 Tax=Elizabethkingia argenteiflava TaxID=2681556 RepID=A0A845PX62_9FLAO|nr:FixH family protein [Elizabethkingia argenteiflava]NAW52225.1 nitrogen fixation protein FixH [Elizabethkingia argenteiflava]